MTFYLTALLFLLVSSVDPGLIYVQIALILLLLANLGADIYVIRRERLD